MDFKQIPIFFLPLGLMILTINGCKFATNLEAIDVNIVTGITCSMPEGTWDNRSSEPGTIVKLVDFETGDLSQCQGFTSMLGGNPEDQIHVAMSKDIPIREGSFAAKFVIKPGEFDSLERDTIHLECLTGHKNFDGDDFYYGYSIHIPFGVSDGGAQFRIPIQFHGAADAGVNPMASFELNEDGTSMKFRSRGGLLTCAEDSSPIYEDYEFQSFATTPGQWNDFIVHIRWDHEVKAKGGVGLVEVWHRADSQIEFLKVVDMSKATLMYGTNCKSGSYFPSSIASPQTRFGIYAGQGVTSETALVFDNFRVGTTLRSVSSSFGCHSANPLNP